MFWNGILQANSILLAIASLYLVYALGAAILLWEWKQLVLALVLFTFLCLTEIALAALAEP